MRQSKRAVPRRPIARTRKALVAALARAGSAAEEACWHANMRMQEAETTTGELHLHASILVDEARERSEIACRREVELENEVVALDESRRAAAKGILVVSANPEVRKTTAEALRSTGELVRTASTTRTGVMKAGDARVVVLDLLTAKGIDGEAFREIGAPVVVISHHESRPVVIGTDHYAVTFTRETLHRAVAAAAA